jgi:hypothetical protein
MFGETDTRWVARDAAVVFGLERIGGRPRQPTIDCSDGGKFARRDRIGRGSPLPRAPRGLVCFPGAPGFTMAWTWLIV